MQQSRPVEVRYDPPPRSFVNLFVLITSSRSSEGVQIGGVCSAAGVVGAWSGAHHKQGWALIVLFSRPRPFRHSSSLRHF